MNILMLLRLRVLSRTSASILPGVPTTMWGGALPFKSFCYCWIGWPPNITSVRTVFMNLDIRSNSPLIWYASSRLWLRTSAWQGSGSSGRHWRTVKTKTAVFPIPDTAWQRTSTPRIDSGMHFCCTSEGCSNPQSTIAYCNSGLRSMSLNDVEWTPT